MLNRIKSLSPSILVGTFLVTFQIVILLTGWTNGWWKNQSVSASSEAVKSVNSYLEKTKEVDQIQNREAKLKAMHKTMYVALFDSKIMSADISSEKSWTEFKNNFQKSKIQNSDEKELEENISLLTNVINQFNQFTTQKNYPTLSRISLRMKMRSLTQMDGKTLENAMYSYSKDVEFMQTTVKTSNLSQELKDECNLKIQELSNTINQVMNLSKNKLGFDDSLDNSWKYFKKFLESAKVNVLKNSMKDGSSFNLLFFMILTLIVFTSLLSAWAIFEEQKSKKNARKYWEVKFTELLNKVFMKDGQATADQTFSNSFSSAVDQIHDYVRRKMNYGQMFQDTIPFPTVLLDSNLQVRWFNESLVQEWNLEDFIKQRESLTWEHFAQLTNMSSTDPIIDVIKNQHAGIFKLQVKPLSIESKSVPYQMYVTPYQIGSERLCLLFFYPLLSLEETIEMQTQSVIAPVKRTLLAILNENYDQDFHNESRSDYEVGSILELHDLFKNVVEKYQTISSDLLLQLSELETDNQDQTQLIQQFDSNVEQIKRLQFEMKESFQSLKNSLIASFEGIENIKDHVGVFKNTIQDEMNYNSGVYNHAMKLENVFNNAKEEFSVLTQLKATTKEVREAILSHRSNSLKVVKAMTVFMEKQNSLNTNPMHNTWGSMISELAKIPDFFSSLERYVQHIDLTIGKILMKTDDSFKQIQNDLPKKIESKLPENINSIAHQFTSYEETKEIMINNLKEIYGSMVDQSKIVMHAQEQLYLSYSDSSKIMSNLQNEGDNESNYTT